MIKLALITIVGLGVAIRIIPYWGEVFTPYGVWFTEMDAWMYMRLADYTAVNFPRFLTYDYYALYPAGKGVGYYPLLIWLISFSGALGFPHLMDIWGAILPPLLSGLLVCMVYWWSKTLFESRAVALLAALLAAVLPSEVMRRGILGFTDQHILEMVLWVAVMLYLTKLQKRIQGGLLIPPPETRRAKSWGDRWSTKGLPLAIALTALVFALYLSNWHGGLFLVFVLGVWVMVEAVMWWLRLGFPRRGLLLPMAAVPVVAYWGAQMWPGLVATARMPFTSSGVIHEGIATDIPWLFISYGLVIGLAILGLYRAIRARQVDSLFIVSMVILIVAAAAQRRWHYYLGLYVAVMGAYGLVWAGNKLRGMGAPRLVWVATVLILIGSLIPGWGVMFGLRNNMTADWWRALTWLKTNSPEPFGASRAYYNSPDGPASYGVLTWWDYGHWVIRVSHRVPTGSPSWQEVSFAYDFLIAQSDERANEALGGDDIRYILLDSAVLGRQFAAIARLQLGDEVDWQTMQPPSMAYRLYTQNQAGGFSMVYQSGDVKVFERR